MLLNDIKILTYLSPLCYRSRLSVSRPLTWRMSQIFFLRLTDARLRGYILMFVERYSPIFLYLDEVFLTSAIITGYSERVCSIQNIRNANRFLRDFLYAAERYQTIRMSIYFQKKNK